MKKFYLILLLISVTSYARDFTSKDIAEWQIAPMGGISSFTSLGDTFYELPFRKAYYYDVKYNKKASTGDLAFGDTRSLSAGMTRHDFDESLFKQYLWADISIYQNKLIFVDSWNYRIFYRDLETKDYSRNGDIIIDQTRPAEDSRGVAPPIEVSNSRYRFKKSLNALRFPSDGFKAMSPVGEQISKENSGAQFLVLTGLKSFPIVTMKCDLQGKPLCKYEHTCMGVKSLENSSAMYFHKETRNLLLIDEKSNDLKIFKYNGCFDITFEGRMKFPSKIPKITDIHIDDEGYLWTSYKRKDQYLSAILVKWKNKLELKK